MSLMQMESTPICSCSFAMRTNSSIVWTGETVYAIVPCAWAPYFLMNLTDFSMLRLSFSASKVRKMSIPFEAESAMKRSSRSSG